MAATAGAMFISCPQLELGSYPEAPSAYVPGIVGAINTVFLGDGATYYRFLKGYLDGSRRVAPYLGGINPLGSIPPGSSTVAFSYTSTATTLTFNWTAGTIYRTDGTTTAVAAGGQLITGLSASTTYYVAICFNEGAGTIALGTGSGAVGSPAYACTSKLASVGAAIISYGVSTFGWYSGATTAGGGGGGGGGAGTCLHETQPIELADGRTISARELSVDDELLCPEGPVRLTKLYKVPWKEWFRVTLNDGVSLLVAGDHRFLDPTDEQISARSLRLQQVVVTRDGYRCVTKLEALSGLSDKVSIEVEEPHTYYVQGVLSHNKVLC
jgi:hypothetical protein